MAWSASAAAAGNETGFEIGLRTGYAIPLGKGGANSSLDLNEGISGAVPIWLDLGYRATPQIMVGIYGAYAFGFLGDTLDRACGGGLDCSSHDIRLGAELQYHILPRQQADPWLGLGLGYEWLTFSASGGGQDGSITASGFEFVNLQAGVDFAPSDSANFGLGPFLAFSVAQYSDVSCSGAAGLACPGSFETTTHEWLTFGVRGTFVP
jgi:hypothetical protein